MLCHRQLKNSVSSFDVQVTVSDPRPVGFAFIGKIGSVIPLFSGFIKIRRLRRMLSKLCGPTQLE